MAIRAQLFDGTVLEFPDGTNQSVIDRVAQEETLKRRTVQPQEIAPPMEPPKREGFGAALGKGIEGLISPMRTAVGAVTGSAEEAALAGLERSKASPYAEQVSLEKVKEAYQRGLIPAAGEVLRQIPLAITEQAPNIAATLGSARLGAMAGAGVGSVVPGIGTAVGTIGGGLLGAVAPSLLQQFGGNIQRQAQEQVEAKKPVDISRTAALAAAVPQAGLDVAATFIPLGRTAAGAILGPQVKQLLERGAKEGAEKLARESLPTVLAKGAGISIATEAPTEVVQSMLERAQAGLPLLSNDALKEYGEAAYQASLIAPIGSAARVGERSAAKAQVQPPELRPGETDRQAAERIQAEILAMKQAAQPPVAPPSPVLDTEKLYNLMAQPNGYALVEQYKQRLAQLPETKETKPAIDAAIEEAAFIQRRAVIEEISRQPTKAVLNERTLKQMGFRPNDGVYESLLGKDMASPDQAEEMTQALSPIKDQEGIAPSLAGKVDNFLATLNEFQESIYPKGPPDVREAVAAPSGAGVPVAGEPSAGVAAEGVAAPVPGGVVPAVEDVGQPVAGEGQKPAPVAPPVAGTAEEVFREAALDWAEQNIKGQAPAEPPVTPPAPATAPPVAAAPKPAEIATYRIVKGEAQTDGKIKTTWNIVDPKDGFVVDAFDKRKDAQTWLNNLKQKSAPTAPVQPVTAPAAEVAEVAEEPVATKEVKTRKPRKPPTTIMGSPMLAGIFNKIGGLHNSLMSEFSTRFITKSLDKNGKPIIRMRNPMIPEIGTLFNKDGKVDFGEIAEHLELEGYLEPGSLERDYKDAGERAKDLIKKALNREEVLPIQDRIDKDVQEREASERQRTLDIQEENRMIASGELQLEPEFEWSDEEIEQNLGLDREFQTDLEMYDMEPKDLEFLSDAELESELTDAERDQARRPPKTEADAARQAAEGAAPGEAETLLTRPTEEGLRAKQEAAEKAIAEEKRTRDAEQERLRKEQATKEERARADESVKDFELGKSAEEQMTGMGDLFGKKSLADIPATRWGEIERKAKAAREMAEKAEATPEQAELNKEIEAKIDELGKVLSRIMGRFGLKDVALNLIEDLKAEGEYGQGVIRLALDAASPVQALRHESIHALKELGFFSPQQWSALEKQAKSKWIDQYLKNVNVNKEPLGEGERSRYDAYMDLYKGDMDAIIEEAIADAFGDFDVNKAPPGLMQALLNRLRQFFDGVKTVFGGEVTAEQVFRKAERGELKAEAAPATEGETKSSLRDAAKIDLDRSLNDKRISPRLPTAVKAKEDAMGEVRLQPDLDTFKRDDVAFRHNIALMSKYPNFSHINGTPAQRAEQMIEHMKGNLLWLFNSWDAKLRDRSKLWYVGGNRISHRWADKYGIPAEQAAGIIAALSPQKDWFQNVSLAERTLDALVFNADTTWSPEMTQVFKDRAWAKKFPLSKYQGTTLKDMYRPGDAKSLVDMSVWIRAWDEANNPQMARVITPEGTFTNEMAAGKTGKPVAMRAQSFAAMVKTLQVLQQTDLQVISDLIGKNHKVRSFYNNIIAPYSGDDVTIDTHAVAAALLRPLGSSDLEVYHNFGSAKPAKKDKEGNILIPASAGTKNSAVTGLYGTYAMYAEAYRRAAQEAGVLPREMQSITWEAIRGLFRPEQKQAKLKNQTNVLWNKVGKGEIDGQRARDEISKLVSGIEDPAWAKSPVGANESRTDSSYADKLPGVSVSGREPAGVPSGTGERVAGAVPEGGVKFSLRSTIPTAARQRIAQTTVTRDEKTFYQRIIEAISPSNFESFRADALNRYNQLSVYDKMLAKAMGGVKLLANSSAEAAALLSDLGAGLTASALGVHDRMGGVPVYKNGITTISNKGGTVKGPTAIFSPLATQPGDYQAYQYWAAVKRGLRLLHTTDPKTGKVVERLITAADGPIAEALRKQYLKEFKIDFESIQEEWIKYNNGLVEFMLDTGVLSQDRADAYRQYADYLPFYRQMNGEETVGPKIFQSIAGVKPPKKIKGGEARLDDFLENIVRNTQSAIQAGVKNIASQRAAQVAVSIQMADRLSYQSSAPNVFHVYENGKPISYKSEDALFINAIKSLGIPDLPFIGFLAGPANLLRNLVTKDPGFMLANLMRDSMSAWVTSGVKMKPMIDTISNFGSALAGKSPEFQALMNAGILGGYEFSQNVEASGREFGKALRKQANVKQPGMKGVLEFGAKPFTSLWEALEKGSTASDAATRIEIYKKTLAETGNEAEALYRALEVMNFNRKGSSAVVRILTAAVPFLNARMQGLDVLYRASTGNMNAMNAKQIQKNFFVRGATIAALSTAYWALTHDDDEYKKQEQETRDNYWLLPSMGVKIPIPFEIGVLFKVIPERLLQYGFGSDTGEDFLKSMARNLMSTLSFNPIPQTALPIIETAANFSFFTMRPIVGQGLEGLQPAYQVGPGTSRLAETIGGATRGLPTELQISPAKLDQLINGYTGTMGMYMVNLMDAIFDMNTDSPKPSRRFEQMPLIRRFALDPEARGSVTAYYELKNKVDSVVRTSNMLERTMNYEELPEFLQDNMTMLASKDYLLDLEKTIKEFREMKIMIRSAQMGADSKRDAISSIEKMENQLTANIQYLKKLAKGG